MSVICQRCGSVDDYRTVVSGPHIKAICNGCDRYIKFISRADLRPQGHTITFQTLPEEQPVSIYMAQGFYGSICIDDLFAGKTVKGSNGKTYICLDDLNTLPFAKGKSNGKTYVGIGTWVNDEEDQYGNIASISLQQTVAEREHQEKKIYIGNMKQAGQKAAIKAAAPAQAATAPQYAGDLPF